MKWIRWRGLAAFIVITVIVSVFWFLVIDKVIEHYIEKAGTSMVGAKVELDKADLSLFPLGLTLTRLQVTDPSSPMRNALEAGRIAFLMDGVNLFLSKVTIDEMSVEGVRFGTQRESSGAVEKPAHAGPEEPPFLTFEIPDAMEVLKKEELESLRLAAEIKGRMESDRTKFAEALKGLPDEKKFESYRERLNALKSRAAGPAEVLTKASSLMALKKEIEADAANIKTLAKDAGKTASYYRERVEFALGAPGRDVQRLTDKYAISPQGLANLSRLFFSGELIEWTDKALMWRTRADRVMKAYKADEGVEVKPRGAGADVRFPERNPTPDFLIRKASVAVNLASGDISGKVFDITGDQHILGRPIRFDFSGERLKGLDSMAFKGEINRVVPEKPRDFASFEVRGYRIKDIKAARGGSMPLELRSGVADLSITAEIRGSALDAGLSAGLSRLDLAAGRADEKNPFLKAGAEALAGVKGFGLKAAAKGTVDDYSLSVTSDLDNVLMASAGKVIAEKAAVFRAKLAKEINEEAGKKLQEMRSELSALNALKSELDSRGLLTDRLIEEITKSLPAKGFRIPGF